MSDKFTPGNHVVVDSRSAPVPYGLEGEVVDLIEDVDGLEASEYGVEVLLFGRDSTTLLLPDDLEKVAEQVDD